MISGGAGEIAAVWFDELDDLDDRPESRLAFIRSQLARLGQVPAPGRARRWSGS